MKFVSAFGYLAAFSNASSSKMGDFALFDPYENRNPALRLLSAVDW